MRVLSQILPATKKKKTCVCVRFRKSRLRENVTVILRDAHKFSFFIVLPYIIPTKAKMKPTEIR